MRYLSVCAGIEAASVAWHPLGWQPAAFSEIEPFPRAVLTQRWPGVPLHGDFTTIGADQYGPIELVVGGTPCQSFSIAGLRGGLGDDRGNLALEFLRLAQRTRPRWLVWENVPGVLSSNGGRDLGSILGGLGELGYGWAYRVLDAQHFGIPQRRRRIFVVGYLGDWRRAAAVLFERHSLSGNPAPRRETRQAAAASLRASAGKRGGIQDQSGAEGLVSAHRMVAFGEYDDDGSASALKARDWKDATDLIAHTLRAEHDASEDGSGRGTPLVPVDFVPETADPLTANEASTYTHEGKGNFRVRNVVAIQERAVSENPAAGPDGAGFRADGKAYTLEARTVPQAVAFSAKDSGADASEDLSPTLRAGGHSGSHANGGVMPAVAINENQQGAVWESETCQALNKGGGKPGQGYAATMVGSQVRRLTPRECERLQGFPDDYTLVEFRGKPAADGPRYKALGNSMAVPVMRWIGERIAMVDAL
jgi:DNA (cytosine-5)-methyltransferase 1